MNICYGEYNTLRALEESEFWKRQESEHTQVIQEVVPDLEEQYVNTLNEYKQIFDTTEAKLVQYIETFVKNKNIVSPPILREALSLIILSVEQSHVFIEFLERLLKESEAVSFDPVASVVINHIRRESEYFIGTVKSFLNINI